MRTTLDIEEDVLQAAKELAEREKTTAGKVLSRLARKGLIGEPHENGNMPRKTEYRNGVPLGHVLRDMVIIVKSCPNNPPVIETITDTCVTAIDTLHFDFLVFHCEAARPCESR